MSCAHAGRASYSVLSVPLPPPPPPTHTHTLLEIRRLAVDNAGWELVPLAPGGDSGVPEELVIRGYTLVKHAQRVIKFTEPGTYVIDE